MPSASREAAFRAKHGMSSGAYYEMRRKAERSGMREAFDKLGTSKTGYQKAKEIIQAKRAAAKAKARGDDSQPFVNAIKDLVGDLPPDIDVGWGSP